MLIFHFVFYTLSKISTRIHSGSTIIIEPNQQEETMTIDHFFTQDKICLRTWGEWLLDTEMSELLGWMEAQRWDRQTVYTSLH